MMDQDRAGEPEGPPPNRNPQQLALGHPFDPPRQDGGQHHDVSQAQVTADKQTRPAQA